jgi:hypothetical protein
VLLELQPGKAEPDPCPLLVMLNVSFLYDSQGCGHENTGSQFFKLAQFHQRNERMFSIPSSIVVQPWTRCIAKQGRSFAMKVACKDSKSR